MDDSKISNAAATTSRKVDQFAEIARDKISAGADKLDQFAGDARNKIQSGIHRAEDAAHSLNNGADAPLQRMAARADQLAACVRDRPFTSLVVMLGVGALLGSLLARSRSSH